jgi:hypothetical protein
MDDFLSQFFEPRSQRIISPGRSPQGSIVNLSGAAGGLVALAGPDGQGRILREASIGLGLAAVEEDGASVAAVLLPMPAAGAEALAGFLAGIHVGYI